MRTKILVGLAAVMLGTYAFAASTAVQFRSGTPVTQVMDVPVDPAAATTTLEAEFCVTTQGQALPAGKWLDGAKGLYVENRSANTCYLTFTGIDPSTMTTTGAKGYKWGPSSERSLDIHGEIFGPWIRAACTGNTTTGACLFLGWWK